MKKSVPKDFRASKKIDAYLLWDLPPLCTYQEWKREWTVVGVVVKTK